MSFLSDLGLESVDADGKIPEGKYDGFVFDAKVIQYKDAAKGQALVLTYKVADGDAKGSTIDEWKSANKFDDIRTKGWLKQRILNLGVPESKINTLDVNDLIGTPIRFTVKHNGQYANVSYVEARNENETPADFSAPAASTSTDDLSDLM